MAPTRRSTRSARPSEEPQPLDDEPVLVAKRKRSSAADSVDKTASRTTRRSSSSKPEPVANTRTRTASRSSTTLKQVQESEDDEIQILPPPKKARSSTDADDVQEVEEVKPPVRSRRAAAPKRGPPAKHEVIVIDDSDDEPAPAIVKPPPRTKSSRKPSMQPKAAPASRVSNGRSSRSASKAIKPDPEEVNDSAVEQGAGSSKVQLEPEDERDDEEEVKPVKGRMAPPKRSTRREVQSTSSVPESDVGPAEEEPQSDGYEDEKSIKPAKGRKAPPKRSTRRAVHSTGTGAESESELASDEDVKPALRRGRKNASPPVSQPSGSGSRTRGRASQGEKPIAPEPEPEPEPEMPWDSDEEVEQLALPPSPKNPPRTPRKEQSPSPAYEEERSLLDMLPPPSPSKASRLQQQPEEPQGPKPRLVIHQLVLVNFKSYAGRQVIGPFHKSFSSIVGPNGSGKSNTIDALLFVFGYRASKMRQGKLSELIHNSAHYPDLDECSVEVHFREIMDLPGPDAFNVIPNSTLIVTRTAYKSSSSKYSINGKNSSLQEVTTLLKGRGIDLDHNRFLILQGEVESISQMPPKGTDHGEGLLEYLEDIIGTSQFKEPIEKSAAEIERINEDRQEKVTRLKIVEKDKNALEGKKREAEQYLRRVNELVRAKSVLFQYYLWKCLEAEETFGVTIEKVERELADEREQNKGNVQLIEALEQNYKERATAWEEVKTFLGDAIKDMAAHEKIEVGLEEKRKHASTKHKKLKRSLQEVGVFLMLCIWSLR
ncbi:hypothetical protein FA95DRAFT_739679 [Auriscalpium vulgare]|uniref:Uncharacterized protein n=1 Tax=Auriscalpium vulgare TaxID=40419 RepID=A0ACB8SC50_9AGAM|nr:hypothetical protein FA95DRAFT_739679 [Auriscalpium vulgare]